MLWYIVTFILGGVLGSLFGAGALLYKINSDIKQLMEIMQYFQMTVEQLGKNYEYFNSLPYKDERVRSLMNKNRVIMTEIKDKVEMTEELKVD